VDRAHPEHVLDVRRVAPEFIVANLAAEAAQPSHGGTTACPPIANGCSPWLWG
jgi:hypothetical protein